MEHVREPALLQTLRGHRGELTCVDVSGARLATGAATVLAVWRWHTPDGWQLEHRAPRAHRFGVTAARWADSGLLLASAGVDGAVRVWSGSLSVRRTLAAPSAAAVRALCWAGHGRLVAGHDDGALRVWHVGRGALLALLHSHDGALHAVTTLADHTMLLAACTEGVLKMFDLAVVCGGSSSPVAWQDGAHDLGALCADGAGSEAVTGGHDGAVVVWRAEGGQLSSTVLGTHSAAVTAVRWARGGLLGSCSLDRTLRLWATHVGTCLRVLHAHTRYLTCLALDPEARFVLTGSNDKSVKMWSLSALSLDTELEVPCAALAHFALGDLEGIGPLDNDLEETLPEDDDTDVEGARRVWSDRAHSGAVNCIAAAGDIVASASSDGSVRVWTVQGSDLQPLHTLRGHQYPAMACDLGAAAALLLSGSLDGRACLWDVQTGVQLRELIAREAGAGDGGGGVRGARVGPQRPPLLLLATDDGLAPLWSLADADPAPKYVFGGFAEAATCCAWSSDGLVAAAGAASGDLRLVAPVALSELYHEPNAHDLGVQSCDFASTSSEHGLPDCTYLLATAGCDDLIKLWIVEYDEAIGTARVELAQSVAAHGGGVTSVRWSGALLASAGADGWARVWRLDGSAPGGTPRLTPDSAVAAGGAGGAGGALSAALAGDSLLVVGSLTGEVSAWRLPDATRAHHAEEDAGPPRLWGPAAVLHWLQENVTRSPGWSMGGALEMELLERVRQEQINGAMLLDLPLDELLQRLACGDEDTKGRVEIGDGDETDKEAEEGVKDGEGGEGSTGRGAVHALLRVELQWLRREPPALELQEQAPHWLLCPLSHRLMRHPARAADGYSYERANILDWLVADEAGVSPVSRRRLRNRRVLPNYLLRDQLRAFVTQHAPDPP